MLRTPKPPVINRKIITAQNEATSAAIGIKNVTTALSSNAYPSIARPPYHSDRTAAGNCVIK